MEWYSIFAAILITLASIIYLYFQRKFSYWKDRGVYHEEPTIPFGNIPSKRKEALYALCDRLYKKKDSLPIVGVYLTTKPVAIATDLDFVKDVLIKDFNNFHGRGIYTNERDDPLSATMFTLDGPKWKALRMKLSPTFTSGKMKFMFPTIVAVAKRFDTTLATTLRSESDINVKDILARFTTDVIGTCAFGLECNSLKDPNTDFRKYGRMIFEETVIGKFSRFLMQSHRLARLCRVRIFPKVAEDFFLGVVRDTVEYREKNRIKRNDFMNLLIDLKNNETTDEENNVRLERLSLEEVAAQAFLFFIAGFETSSTTMMFALYELALNPEIQEKARKEIDSVLAKHKGEVTYETVKEMIYLDRIINETLRKYPPLPLRRMTQKDYPIANSKLVLSKGTTILIPAYSIHHDPNIYTDPEKFDPKRFEPDQIQARHPIAFLGFGNGPRNCLGLRFGRLQTQIGLMTLLKSYRFKPSPKTPIPMVFSETNQVLSPVDGLHLEVERIVESTDL